MSCTVQCNFSITGTCDALKQLQNIFQILAYNGDCTDEDDAFTRKQVNIFKGSDIKTWESISATLINSGTETEPATLRFHGLGKIDIGEISDLFRAWLAETDSNEFITFQWSESGGQYDRNQHSGGAVFITSEDVGSYSTGDFVTEKMKEYRDALEAENDSPAPD